MSLGLFFVAEARGFFLGAGPAEADAIRCGLRFFLFPVLLFLIVAGYFPESREIQYISAI